jgi:heme exporter protein B
MIEMLIWRDLARAFRNGGIALPVAFFLLVATLYPFAVGPDGALLAKTGGGVLWVAALLAALLPVDRLIAPDVESGVLDQLAVRGIADEVIAVAKIAAHWLGFGPALMLATIPAAALLRLDGPTLRTVELGLLLGTPGLAALGVMIARAAHAAAGDPDPDFWRG